MDVLGWGRGRFHPYLKKIVIALITCFRNILTHLRILCRFVIYKFQWHRIEVSELEDRAVPACIYLFSQWNIFKWNLCHEKIIFYSSKLTPSMCSLHWYFQTSYRLIINISSKSSWYFTHSFKHSVPGVALIFLTDNENVVKARSRFHNENLTIIWEAIKMKR